MADFDKQLESLIENATTNSISTKASLDHMRETAQNEVDQIRQASIHSIDQLYALISDEQVEPKLRETACSVMYQFISQMKPYGTSKLIDRRRALPPLLKAAKSADDKLRSAAVWTLARLKNKRAFKVLTEIAENDPLSDIRGIAISSLGWLDETRSFPILAKVVQDKTRTEYERIMAIQALVYQPAEQVVPILLPIAQDKSENLEVRSVVIEWSAYPKPNLIPAYIEFLNDDIVEIRFWAAFGMMDMTQFGDTSSALAAYDRAIAYDHAPAPGWWQVSREAILPFEWSWYRKLANLAPDEYMGVGSYVVSPLLEYWNYQQKTRQYNNSEMVFTPLEQSTTLDMDPLWLQEQIRTRWPNAKFNVRQPKPECYRLDWQIDIQERMMIGGLHRDGYLIVLMGRDEDAAEFAVWFRGLISSEHVLRFYQWADFGVTIKPDMTPQQLADLCENLITFDDMEVLGEA